MSMVMSERHETRTLYVIALYPLGNNSCPTINSKFIGLPKPVPPIPILILNPVASMRLTEIGAKS